MNKEEIRVDRELEVDRKAIRDAPIIRNPKKYGPTLINKDPKRTRHATFDLVGRSAGAVAAENVSILSAPAAALFGGITAEINGKNGIRGAQASVEKTKSTIFKTLVPKQESSHLKAHSSATSSKTVNPESVQASVYPGSHQVELAAQSIQNSKNPRQTAAMLVGLENAAGFKTTAYAIAKNATAGDLTKSTQNVANHTFDQAGPDLS